MKIVENLVEFLHNKETLLECNERQQKVYRVINQAKF